MFRVECIPLTLEILLSLLLLLGLLLPGLRVPLELVAVDLHVGADHLVSNRRHRLVPMRRLLAHQ